MRNIAIAVAILIAGATGASAQQKPAVDTAKVDADIVKAFPTAPADWKPRFDQDETMKECSMQREFAAEAGGRGDRASARRPGSNIPPTASSMGDWKAGEKLAQSGYGLRFTDYPARQTNGGNCYACHQLTKAEVSYGTIGPTLLELRKDPQFQRGRHQGGVRKDLQRAGGLSVLEHAALRHQQGADHRSDQGPGRAGDEPGQPGEQV